MRTLARLVSAIGLLCLGCSEEPRDAGPTYGGRGRVASTRGAAIVLTYDERVAVATNRTSGIITVIHLDEELRPEIAKKIDVGVEARPWAAVIGDDDDSAYVLLRGSQRVIRVRGLHSKEPTQDAQEWPTGAEPTAIAITPSGARVYVANWADGTISTFRTTEESTDEATDLNFEVAKTGVLGPLTEAVDGDGTAIWTDGDFAKPGAVRPGLAHPRSLAMTDDGDQDDHDETLYATEFFSQPLLDSTETDPDLSRQGFVYAIEVATGQPPVDRDTGKGLAPISLSALSTGFQDAEGSPTSCFPNQLMAAAVEGDRLFVTSMCASPRGPVDPGPEGSPANFMTLMHPAIFVIDTITNREVREAAVVLTRKMVDLHGDEDDLRMPLIPNDIAIRPHDEGESAGGVRLYVTAFGADAVFSIDYRPDGMLETIGSPGAPFVDLTSHSRQVPNAGRLPVGIALTRSATEPTAFVLTDFSDVLAIIDLEGAAVRENLPALAPDGRVSANVRQGRRLFATGLDNWSFRGQAWSSCESCHPDGLSDGVVWRFARGPRRTISTAGTYYGGDEDEEPTRRVLLWTANVDEIHDVEAIARGVSGGAGGVAWTAYRLAPNVDCRLLFAGEPPREAGGAEDCPGQISTTVRHNGLNGSLASITYEAGDRHCEADAGACDVNARPDWDLIDAFIRSVEAPQAPTTLNESYRLQGEELFATLKCAACHGGPGWTVSRMFYEPSQETNGAVPYERPAPEPEPDVAPMLGSLRVASYTAPVGLAGLNQPLAKALQALGEPRATFRSWAPADSSTAKALEYVYTGADQVNCALRSVGTFPAPPTELGAAPSVTGTVAPGAPAVTEIRRTLDPPLPGSAAVYTEKIALGAAGFNVPSLTGLALAGSYFHAGNARTLEELLGATFARHHQNPAVAPEVELTPQDVRALVTYLLSIDETTRPVEIPMIDVDGLSFDPDLCAQF